MDENGKITLEDINSLSIVKKFVCIQSSKYNEEAYNRILELIDAEQAILFDKDTHKIYTLGTYYGGNLSKDDFLYFSSIVNVDEADEILNKIEALKNSIHIKPFENPSDSLLWGLYEQLKKLREE